jgi:hypothetical protein
LGVKGHACHPKNIVSDESQCPIAVQIDYADRLEIERSLNLTSDDAKTVDPSQFAGVISLTEDALAYQLRVRGEW